MKVTSNNWQQFSKSTTGEDPGATSIHNLFP